MQYYKEIDKPETTVNAIVCLAFNDPLRMVACIMSMNGA